MTHSFMPGSFEEQADRLDIAVRELWIAILETPFMEWLGRPEWQDAAARWRDEVWHPSLGNQEVGPGRKPRPL